jgi:hypothetical protein
MKMTCRDVVFKVLFAGKTDTATLFISDSFVVDFLIVFF